MKFINYQFSQVTYLSTIVRRAGQIYIPNALANFQQRYNFIEIPETSSYLNPEKGIKFKHGKFEDISIAEISLYPDGIVAHSSAPVEVIERFVDDVVRWTEDALQAEEISSLPSVKLFDSHVIVQSAIEFGSTLQKIEGLGHKISILLDRYGIATKPYTIGGIGLYNDEPDGGMYKTSKFTFERKADQPFSQNLYFSTAPLRSKDHLELLALLEKAFSD